MMNLRFASLHEGSLIAPSPKIFIPTTPLPFSHIAFNIGSNF
ncbi:MAG: hypothetical protein NZ937_09335 [Armatimonadetes bacterium]|nr:hypothetical protein [Armatimonadota bacterium]MDW8030041.1 hypothetical protein [Armatimonadota bacterium]